MTLSKLANYALLLPFVLCAELYDVCCALLSLLSAKPAQCPSSLQPRGILQASGALLQGEVQLPQQQQEQQQQEDHG
jgi:hypothetical protein